MKAIIKQISGKFPEPGFSALQREVFGGIQAESAQLAAILEQESSDAAKYAEVAPAPSSMIRFGAYLQDELIGWSCGCFERGQVFYMANSGVHPRYQRQGVYSALLETILQYAGQHGASVIRSQHSVLNNRIIICKLKRGFQISGLSFSAQMGSLVELTLHLSAGRGELFAARTIPLAPAR